MRFAFTGEDSYEDENGDFQTSVTRKEFSADTWPEALERFEEFLRGCGFIFHDELTAVIPSIYQNKDTNDCLS